MKELIDKAAVVAEIEIYISHYKDIVAKIDRNDSTWVDSVSMIDAKIDVLQHLLSFLDTLEVKEVDFEKEVTNWWNDHYKKINDDYEFGKYNGHYMENSTIINFAKHFFELGMQQSKNDNHCNPLEVVRDTDKA